MSEANNILLEIGGLDVGDQFTSSNLGDFNTNNVVRVVSETNCVKPIAVPIRGTETVYSIVGKPHPLDLSICRDCDRLKGSGSCPIFQKASESY